jgi:hypothetical protein
MIIESICIACVVLGGLYSISPTKKPESTAAVAPALPPMASSNGNFYHATTTSGEGSSAIVNLNLVNNNGSNQTTPPPPPPQYETTQQYFKKAFESLHFKDLASASYEYCCQNKYYLATFSVAGTYGYMFYKVRSIQSYVDNPGIWGTWKRDIPFEQLLAIPQDQLTRELMMAIQGRYISAENPTDSLAPLITFASEIAEEKELLTNYHTYVSWCMQFSLQRVMPCSQTLLTQLNERKQRATYLSTLFQSWLAHYKLEQITRSRSSLQQMACVKAIDKMLNATDKVS